MPARNSPKSADHDRRAGRERVLRSSGRRGDRVKVGHDKMGRPRYRNLSKPTPRPRRVGLDERKYPNLAALRDLEHEEHVRRAMEMGLTRKQAQRHARHDEREGLRNPRLWPEPVRRRTRRA